MTQEMQDVEESKKLHGQTDILEEDQGLNDDAQVDEVEEIGVLEDLWHRAQDMATLLDEKALDMEQKAPQQAPGPSSSSTEMPCRENLEGGQVHFGKSLLSKSVRGLGSDPSCFRDQAFRQWVTLFFSLL